MEKKTVPKEVWSGDGGLKKWSVHIISDTLKTLSILGVLFVFWEGISLLRFMHYPEERLASLEKVHFAFMYCAQIVLGCNFLIKLVIELWPKKKK